MPELTIINGDTESNVDTAREHAEKLINDGAQLLIGAFDSGQTTAVAQVAEQKGIPLVINVASAPEITEQGYKFVVRNFPTVQMLLSDELDSQKEVFEIAGAAPKAAVFMHVNDLFGTGMSKGLHGMMPKYNLPYTIVDEISYDPAARDLSVEVTKAKATNAEIMLVVGRLNDAMLLTREMIKQRWTPQAILSMGPGWYENQYTKTLGKMSDGPISLVPWYDPNKKLSQMLEAALAKAYPDFNLNTNHVYTFEALLVAADAYKRAGSADPKALAEALHATNITDNATIGPGIKFDAKGQNTGVKCGAIQNRAGKQVTIAPKQAANAKLEWPMKPYQDRA
jgi:branched-chain amino acid transport system substrate-binding protein